MAYLGHEHIYAFDDFITEEDASELIRFHDEEFKWESHYSWVAPLEQYNKGPVVLTGAYGEEIKRRQAEWDEKSTHPLSAIYGEKIMHTASETFGRTLVHRLTPYYKKFQVGSDHSPHADCEAQHAGVVEFMPRYSPSEFNTPTLIEVAANLYLTDDFDGGELYFPTRDLVIKPKARQLILFPGGHEYIHGVKQVTRGDRNVLFSPLTSPQRLLLHMHAYNTWHELQEAKNERQ
jgi:predicted 2-oxoglutarate/Fe(II)-dependent dioxygenase YbiX